MSFLRFITEQRRFIVNIMKGSVHFFYKVAKETSQNRYHV